MTNVVPFLFEVYNSKLQYHSTSGGYTHQPTSTTCTRPTTSSSSSTPPSTLSSTAASTRSSGTCPSIRISSFFVTLYSPPDRVHLKFSHVVGILPLMVCLQMQVQTGEAPHIQGRRGHAGSAVPETALRQKKKKQYLFCPSESFCPSIHSHPPLRFAVKR